ncbi:hypothetical protein E3J84_05990 [Candidatus Aerophobetes bacterium]|uniref:Uncharacterized protein n=1 Tax=Aerophobetes bacterium TaxID=2030807 RepID=A0A523RS85_UNCAE|nr:MAG: hypothetical protein E3J84_05990 [Candidatus Aerophobetes bacterium]
MAGELTEYQKGYVAGLKDKPARKAATFTREIKPELLDYPVAMRDKKAAYASLREWDKLRRFLEDAKKGDCEVICIAFPEVLGDNYMDFVACLSLIAEYGFQIGVAGKSPFLIEWGEHYPIFNVPGK